jgi:hypothetical protein
MDLSDFDTKAVADAGAVLHLHGPTGQPLFQDDGETPVTITLLGDDSSVVTAANAAASNLFLRSMGAGGQQLTVEVTKANELKKFGAATVGWSGIVVEGKEIDFTTASAVSLYRRFPWIADQIRVFISDRANFLRPSPKA